MYTIENDRISVSINPHGGCFKSIYDKVNKKELLYQPDGTSWNGQDVVIFPVIAALKNHTYEVDGNSYELKNHGLIRYNDVYLISNDGTKIVLGFDYDNNTLKLYPYKFHFEISYRINENKIIVEYYVKNLDDKSIFFSLGGHPALYSKLIDHDFSDVSIYIDGVLSKQYLLNSEGSQIVKEIPCKITGNKKITKTEIIKEKTLIYDASLANSVILKNNDYKFTFDISMAKVLAIWSMGEGEFLCIEPWWGLPDYDVPQKELCNKEGIITLNEKGDYRTFYSIAIDKIKL